MKAFLLIFLLACPVEAATERFVKKTGVNAAGGCISPCLTIGFAMMSMVGGDTLTIGTAGATENYVEQIINTIPNGPNASNPTIIRALPNATVWIMPNVSGASGILIGPTQNYITIDGIGLDNVNANPGGDKNAQCLWHDGSNAVFQNMEIKNCAIGIHWGGSSSRATNLNIHHNLNVDNAFSQCQAPGGCTGYGIYMGGSDNIVEKSQLHDNHLYAVQVYSQSNGANRNILRRNLVWNNGSSNTIASSGLVIGGGDGNRAEHNVLWNNRLGIEAGGAAGTNTALYDNTIYGSYGTNSYGSGITGSCLLVGGMTGTLIKNNICYGNALNTIAQHPAASGTSCDGNLGFSFCTAGTIPNPLFVNTSTNDFHICAGSGMPTGCTGASPAIAIGVNLTNTIGSCPVGDKDDVAHPCTGNWSEGAYEPASGTPAPNTPPVEDFVYAAGTNLSGLTGGINWNGGWINGACGSSITAEVPPSGSLTAGNAARSSGLSQACYERAFTAVATGTIRWQWRSSITTGFNMVSLRDASGNHATAMALKPDGHIHACADYGNDTDLGAYTANTWPFMSVEFDATGANAKKFRVQINQGTFSAWIDFCQSASFTASQVDHFLMFDNTAVTHDFWVDSIGAAATMLVFTTQPPATVTTGATFAANVSATYSNGSTPVPGATNSITLAVCAASPSATLSAASGLTKAASNGTASWTDLVLTQPAGAVGVTLCATTSMPTLTSGESSPITINSGTPPVTQISSPARIRAGIR